MTISDLKRARKVYESAIAEARQQLDNAIAELSAELEPLGYAITVTKQPKRPIVEREILDNSDTFSIRDIRSASAMTVMKVLRQLIRSGKVVRIAPARTVGNQRVAAIYRVVNPTPQLTNAESADVAA